MQGGRVATILAHITVKEGKGASFEEISRRLYARSHAAETDIIRYEYWRGQDRGCYYCLLSFPDYRLFMIHQTSDHHEAEVAGLGEVMAKFRLEWIDPVPGASPLLPTRAQTLGDDATPLARKYEQSLPLTIAEWWKTAGAG